MADWRTIARGPVRAARRIARRWKALLALALLAGSAYLWFGVARGAPERVRSLPPGYSGQYTYAVHDGRLVVVHGVIRGGHPSVEVGSLAGGPMRRLNTPATAGSFAALVGVTGAGVYYTVSSGDPHSGAVLYRVPLDGAPGAQVAAPSSGFSGWGAEVTDGGILCWVETVPRAQWQRTHPKSPGPRWLLHTLSVDTGHERVVADGRGYGLGCRLWTGGVLVASASPAIRPRWVWTLVGLSDRRTTEWDVGPTPSGLPVEWWGHAFWADPIVPAGAPPGTFPIGWRLASARFGGADRRALPQPASLRLPMLWLGSLTVYRNRLFVVFADGASRGTSAVLCEVVAGAGGAMNLRRVGRLPDGSRSQLDFDGPYCYVGTYPRFDARSAWTRPLKQFLTPAGEPMLYRLRIPGMR